MSSKPPKPRWRLWVVLACCVLAVMSWIVVAVRADARRQCEAQLMAAKPSEIANNPVLLEFAIARGRTAFQENCVTCHGSDARGKPGYPNLTDHDWLWGGSLGAIEQTITHGIRIQDQASRFSEMPAFLRDNILTPAQVDDVAAYVARLSGQDADAEAAQRGAQVFSQNCFNCHGSDGKGDPSVGAPNLTDTIWLYGGDPASLHQSIAYARNSSMPSWSGRLSPVTIRALAVYVYSLGGGEPEATP